MKIRLRSIAEVDAAEAIQWYAEQKPDLVFRFFEAPSSAEIAPFAVRAGYEH